MEDYLESVRVLGGERGTTSVTGLSRALGVSKPSVTAAVARLAEEGLLYHERYGAVTLTERGRLVADDVWRRHRALRVFLIGILGVSSDTAEEDACKLEHHLSPATSERLGLFVEFALAGRAAAPRWLEEFAATLGAVAEGSGSPAPTGPAGSRPSETL
jgi:DtxR family Mn-dependent transcriptional regulator